MCKKGFGIRLRCQVQHRRFAPALSSPHQQRVRPVFTVRVALSKDICSRNIYMHSLAPRGLAVVGEHAVHCSRDPFLIRPWLVVTFICSPRANCSYLASFMLRADSASDSSLAISFRILQPASAAATASGPWRR